MRNLRSKLEVLKIFGWPMQVWWDCKISIHLTDTRLLHPNFKLQRDEMPMGIMQSLWRPLQTPCIYLQLSQLRCGIGPEVPRTPGEVLWSYDPTMKSQLWLWYMPERLWAVLVPSILYSLFVTSKRPPAGLCVCNIRLHKPMLEPSLTTIMMRESSDMTVILLKSWHIVSGHGTTVKNV